MTIYPYVMVGALTENNWRELRLLCQEKHPRNWPLYRVEEPVLPRLTLVGLDVFWLRPRKDSERTWRVSIVLPRRY